MRKPLFLFLILTFLGSFTSQAQNLIKNGGFENDFSNWFNQASPGANANFSIVTTDPSEGGKAMKVEVITSGANAWDVQSINDAWASEAGKSYTLTFFAKAATAGSQFKVIQQIGDSYADQTITLTTAWTKYEWVFTAGANGLQLKFHFPSAGTFYIDGINIPNPTPVQTQNLISNGSFENDFTGWNNLVGGGGAATFALETLDKIDGGKAMKVNVTTPGANPYDIQSINTAWPSVAQKSYTLSFFAKAATAGTRLRVVQQTSTYAQQEFNLTTTWQKYEWTFTAQEAGLQLRFNFPVAGTYFIDKVEIPVPVQQATNLIPNGGFENDFTSWTNLANTGAATFSIETTDRQEGNKAMKVNVVTPGPNAWDVQSINNAWLSKTGQEYTLTFFAKAATAGSQFKVIQQVGSSYLDQTITLTTTWTKYEWIFTAGADGLQLKFHFPSAGTFYIDNIYIPGSDTGGEPAPQPYTPTGPPIATGQPKFLGGVYSASQLPNFNNYWNQVVPENAGKWGSVEATRDVMNWTELDAAYKLAQDNGYPFRMHVLVWGNQQPAWIENLPANEQLEEIKEWFAAVAARYPNIAFLEVVNEPTNDPPLKRSATDQGSGNYMNALGGSGTTGWDWVLTSFRLARQYFPNTKLMLNDYSVENTIRNAERYLVIVRLLQQEKLIDAVGIQGHAFSTQGTSTATLKSIMDMYGQTNLPVYITELDIDGITDAIQLAEYKRVFPIYWEHPALKGITLWGYRPGHWRTDQGAYLAHTNGAERSALKWLREYVQANTNVKIPVITPSQVFGVSEAAANNTVVGTAEATDADAGTTFQGWRITGGTGAAVFAIDPATGQIKVANQSLLDFEKTTSYTLTLTVHDGFSTSPAELVTVQIINANDNAPVVKAAQQFVLDAPGFCNVIGTATATDADDTNQAGFTGFKNWQITGGTGAAIFAIDATSGKISVINPLQIDFSKTAYTLLLTVNDGVNNATPETLTITIPNRVRVCHRGIIINVEKRDAKDHLKHGDCLGGCAKDNQVLSTPTSAKNSAEGELSSENLIQVYPNPVQQSVTVSLGKNDMHFQKIILQDITGRFIKEISINGASNVVIPRGNLKSGIYLLQLQGDKDIYQRILVE